MGKRIKRINDMLDSHPISVAICFPPLALPIDEFGIIVDEDAAQKVHYSTVVYSKKIKAFFIFEFPQNIFDGISYYEMRNVKKEVYEILLKRDEEGELRMTVGMKHKDADFIPTRDDVEKLYNQLYGKYVAKKNYYVADL